MAQEIEACRHYEYASDAYSRCLDRRLAVVQKSLALLEAGVDWLGQFGYERDDPDFDVRYGIALRQGVVYALILERCQQAAERHLNVDTLNSCLDLQAKIEKGLGNDLEQPLP